MNIHLPSTVKVTPEFSGEYDRNKEDIYRKFISAIESAMEGELIRYSRRVKLLKLAERLGIERFEANLIIAQTQRRIAREMSNAPRTTKSVSSNQSISELRKEKETLKEKFFVAAAIFIIAAITDLVLIRYLFNS